MVEKDVAEASRRAKVRPASALRFADHVRLVAVAAARGNVGAACYRLIVHHPNRRMDPRNARELLHPQSDWILEPALEMSPGEANPPRDGVVSDLEALHINQGERVIDRAGQSRVRAKLLPPGGCRRPGDALQTR